MWQVQGRPIDPRRFTPFEPAEVLYEFDGPRVFTLWDAEGELNLAYWSDADGESDRYLVVPTTPAVIDLLRTGGVSVSEALRQPRCWACDVTFDGRIGRCVSVDPDAVPSDARPAPDTPLLPTLDPSRLRQARQRIDSAARTRSSHPTAVNLEGRIGQFDLDLMSFDLRDVGGGGQPDQQFVFDVDLYDDVFRLAHDRARVRVAGLTFPGRSIAYASVLTRL